MGRGDLRRSRRYDPFAGAPHGGDAHAWSARHGRCSAPTTASSRIGRLILLASALGQIGLPGGGFGFGYGSAVGIAEPSPAFGPPTMEVLSNPLGRRSRGRASPTVCCSPGEEYDYNGKKGTYPDLQLVYWAGGNPFHHHQDTNKLRRAWGRPETIVVHEPWWTATARHADIVLPATTSLERNDIGGFASRPLSSSPCSRRSSRSARRVATTRSSPISRAALGCEATYTQGRDEMEWLRHLYESLARQGAHQPGGASRFRRLLE